MYRTVRQFVGVRQSSEISVGLPATSQDKSQGTSQKTSQKLSANLFWLPSQGWRRFLKACVLIVTPVLGISRSTRADPCSRVTHRLGGAIGRRRCRCAPPIATDDPGLRGWRRKYFSGWTSFKVPEASRIKLPHGWDLTRSNVVQSSALHVQATQALELPSWGLPGLGIWPPMGRPGGVASHGEASSSSEKGGHGMVRWFGPPEQNQRVHIPVVALGECRNGKWRRPKHWRTVSSAEIKPLLRPKGRRLDATTSALALVTVVEGEEGKPAMLAGYCPHRLPQAKVPRLKQPTVF